MEKKGLQKHTNFDFLGYEYEQYVNCHAKASQKKDQLHFIKEPETSGVNHQTSMDILY